MEVFWSLLTFVLSSGFVFFEILSTSNQFSRVGFKKLLLAWEPQNMKMNISLIIPLGGGGGGGRCVLKQMVV